MQAAKKHRLAKVAEEAAEVIQAICKIQCYGEVSAQGDNVYNHKASLESELGDLFANLKYLIDGGYLDIAAIQKRMDEKEAYLAEQDGAVNIVV